MPNLIAVHHVAMNCRNIHQQEAFYMKHFGFKRSRTFRRGTPEEFFMLKLGSVRLELFTTLETEMAGLQGGEQPVGFKHLAFEVPTLEPVLEALKADGIEVDPIIEMPHLVPGFRIVFFRDPEGNILELMEGYHDEVN